MNTPNFTANLTIQQTRAANAASGLFAKIDGQMAQTQANDEVPGADQAPGEMGKVEVSDSFASASLDYDPASGQPSEFSFKANDNITTPQGQLITPKGLETNFKNEDGVMTYSQDQPTNDGGTLRQEAVLNNQDQTVTYNEWILA